MGELLLDESKIKFHQERLKKWVKGEWIAPITIDLSLTQACNYSCKYCYSHAFQQRKGNKITWNIMKHFLEDCQEMGVKGLSFVSDGETTCNSIYPDVITYTKELGISAALGTNGYLLDKPSLEKILPALTYLRFNVSAGEPKRYAEIHGVTTAHYDRVIENILTAVEIKKKRNLDCAIGLQMVLMPEFKDQIIPLAELGKKLGVDYLVIKHCSDDEEHGLGIDYEKYHKMESVLKKAEKLSTNKYMVKVKWNKIADGDKRTYSQCYGARFHLQISGSGLVAPCGCFFGDKYKKYHIGDFTKKRFKDILHSEKYYKVFEHIESANFDAKKECPYLCLQHLTNKVLDSYVKGETTLDNPFPDDLKHSSFI